MGETPARARARAGIASLLTEARAATLEAAAMFERAERMQRDNEARRQRAAAASHERLAVDPLEAPSGGRDGLRCDAR
jgi:hypothetical protein